LHPIVGNGRQIANVVEMGVADEASFEPALRFERQPARERSRIEGEIVVDQERARSMLGRLPAVTADDAKVHASSSAFWRGRYP
jgi:hypothetical protein